MKIHRVLLEDFLGESRMETLCDLIVIPTRNEDGVIQGFKTPTGNTVQCVLTRLEPDDVNCLRCRKSMGDLNV